MRFINEKHICRKVKEIASFGLGLTYTPNYVAEGIPFISSKNISQDFLDLSDINYISLNEYNKISKNCKPQKGDILFTRVGSNLGHPVIFNTEKRIAIFVSLGFLRIKNTVNNEFVKHWMNSKSFWNQVKTKIAGSSKMNLNIGWLENFNIYLPSIDCQEKISVFLNLIEDRIKTQMKIIKNLQSLINGIINESFSEKGLFKDGTLVSLKDILLEGKKVPVDTKVYKKITIKLNKEGVVFSNISREMSDTRPFYIREKGELIIGKQNYFNGSIAIISKEYDQTICSNAIMSFKIKNSYNNDFIYHCVSNDLFLRYRSHLANGTGQKELSEKDFLSFAIRLPDQSTQEKIVRRINLVTQKLNAEKKILLLYEKQKQYLLDKLFI